MYGTTISMHDNICHYSGDPPLTAKHDSKNFFAILNWYTIDRPTVINLQYRHWFIAKVMELFSRRRWTNRLALKSNKYGMLPCMWWIIFGGFVKNITAYHLGRYCLHLLLLKSSMLRSKQRTLIVGGRITLWLVAIFKSMHSTVSLHRWKLVFSFLVSSNLVKLETSHTVILAPMVSVLWSKPWEYHSVNIVLLWHTAYRCWCSGSVVERSFPTLKFHGLNIIFENLIFLLARYLWNSTLLNRYLGSNF